MKEVFHGYTIDQVGLVYYNIPHLLTHETNQASTSHQEAAPVGNDDVQVVQSSSEQVQGATTNRMQNNPGLSVQHVQQPTGKFRIKWLILAHQAKYRHRLKK